MRPSTQPGASMQLGYSIGSGDGVGRTTELDATKDDAAELVALETALLEMELEALEDTLATEVLLADAPALEDIPTMGSLLAEAILLELAAEEDPPPDVISANLVSFQSGYTFFISPTGL